MQHRCGAIRGSASSPMGAPVLRLRSKRGKLLLISRRMAWPARKRFDVTRQSIANSSTPSVPVRAWSNIGDPGPPRTHRSGRVRSLCTSSASGGDGRPIKWRRHGRRRGDRTAGKEGWQAPHRHALCGHRSRACRRRPGQGGLGGHSSSAGGPLFLAAPRRPPRRRRNRSARPTSSPLERGPGCPRSRHRVAGSEEEAALEATGNGEERAAEVDALAPGQAAGLGWTVTEPGAFQFVCRLLDHNQRGMVTAVEVVP